MAFAASPETLNVSERSEFLSHWSEGQTIPGKWKSPLQTLQLNLVSASDREDLGFALAQIAPSYRLLLNGKVVFENGSVAKRLPQYSYGVVPIQLRQGLNLLTLELADYWSYRSHLKTPIKIGVFKTLAREQNLSLGEDCTIFGLLLAIAFQQWLTYFVHRRKNKVNFYFGTLCALMSLRILLTGQFRLLYQLDLGLDWIELQKAEFINAYLIEAVFLWFFCELFPKQSRVILAKCFLGIGLLFTLNSLANPLLSTYRAAGLFQFSLVPLMLTLLFWITRAFREKEEGAGIILLATCTLVALGVNDILYSQQIIHTMMLGQVGVAFFALVYALVIEQKTWQSATALAFYGRFIRPGLKTYLKRRVKTDSDVKSIHRIQIPILKIDIVDFTPFVSGMPHEVRRLFTDLWCELIDQQLEDKILMDKFEGDGSIYYLKPDIPGGSCTFAMQCASEIIENTTSKFDLVFRKELKTLTRENPNLVLAMADHAEKYRAKTGKNFLTNPTRVRFAMVYGFVDEGLWGMTSHSHYDISGDILITLARIEKEASENQVVASSDFLTMFHAENGNLPKDYQVTWLEKNLKGLGPTRFALLEKRSAPLRQVA